MKDFVFSRQQDEIKQKRNFEELKHPYALSKNSNNKNNVQFTASLSRWHQAKHKQLLAFYIFSFKLKN